MKCFVSGLLIVGSLFLHSQQNTCFAQPDPRWRIHDITRPNPPFVTPGTPSMLEQFGSAPSDAVILFDGNDLSAWESQNGEPARWKVENGYVEIVQSGGSIRTKQAFGDFQMHIEWCAQIQEGRTGQNYGNSGVLMMEKYEIQVLNSYDSKTYADGQAAAIYGQYPPLVNVSRPPGQWQSYDIIFRRPHFDASGNLLKPASVTILHNGVLVQDNVRLTGPMQYMARPSYEAHPDKLPIMLQNHSQPTRFRNIWIRELEPYEEWAENNPAPPLPAVIELNDRTLDKYVGEYGTGTRAGMRIEKEGNHLLLYTGGDRPLTAIYPSSETTFFSKTVAITIQFSLDDNGMPNSATFLFTGDSERNYEKR